MLPIAEPGETPQQILPAVGPAAPPRARLGWTVARLARSWRSVLDARLAPHGLTQSRWRVLNVVSTTSRPLTQRELADRLAIEAPTLVRLLDRLEADGLVERRPDGQDRRRKVIGLGPKAAPATDAIAREIAAVRADLLGGLTDDQIAQALLVLDAVQGAAEHLLAAMPRPESEDRP
ncbi:MarR family transcriptional regulator [Tistrella bauzanensis]|uniref:MarR family transcriptional regulator n=2 Tax=Tistrella arctica TaxID=3133430 RepID=A0ABU9YQR2_9PROT